MVEIDRLIEKKAKRGPQEEKNRANSIAKAECHIRRGHTEKSEVQIHPNARPGVDPREAVVAEEKARRDPIAGDPAMRKISHDLAEHEQAESDSEKDQRRDVHRLECACLNPSKK